MEENNNPAMDTEETQLEKEDETPFEHYVAAAIMGAAGSILLLYLYRHLSEDTKENVKDNVISFAKKQLAKFCEE